MFGKKSPAPDDEIPNGNKVPLGRIGQPNNIPKPGLANIPSQRSSAPPLGNPSSMGGGLSPNMQQQAPPPPPAATTAALSPAMMKQLTGNSEMGLPIEIILETLTTMMKAPVGRDVIRGGLPLVGGFISERGLDRAIKNSGLVSQRIDAFKGSAGARTPFIIVLPSGRTALGLRWNIDNSLDVMGLDLDSEGNPSIRQLPYIQAKSFLPKKVLGVKRVAKAVRKSSDNTKLTGLGRFEHWFWPIFRAQWKGYVYACVATFLLSVMTVLASFYTMQVYDRVLPSMALDTLWVLTMGVMIAHTFGFIVKNLQSYFLDTAGRKIDLIVSSDLFTRVMGIKSKDRPKNSGSFAQTFRDFENVREFFSSITMSAVVEIPFSLVFVFAIFLVAGPLGYIPLIMGPVILAISFASQVWIERSITNSMQAGSEKNAVLVECLSGMESIKSLTAESHFQQRWEDAVEVGADSSRIMRLASGITQALSTYLQSIASVLVLVFGVYLAADQTITTGGIIAATMLSGRALQPYLKLTGLLARYKQVKMSIEVIEKLSEQESEWKKEDDHIDQPVDNGSITFQKASFSYPEAKSPSIQEISFDIQAGERVGIIGPSGSGKSTLSKLILGLYEPDSGSIMVGGMDNRQYNPRALRRAVAYSPQDPFIFGGTVAENIKFGNDQAGASQVLQAAKEAGVDIFTSTHPDGLSMQAGELGRNLSGGQRQTLSLARSYIKDCKIMVLDEPSNSLDAQTEALLVETIRNQPRDRTIILITHRPALLQSVTRLICMDKGKMIMEGGRDEVLQRLGGQAFPQAQQQQQRTTASVQGRPPGIS